MINSGHLKRISEDALQINLKAASVFTHTLKNSFIITITGGKEISYYANDNFCKTSTHSTKELIAQITVVYSDLYRKDFTGTPWLTIGNVKQSHLQKL